MVLNKRIFREFKQNIIRYLGLFLLIVLGHSIVVGGIGGNQCIITTVDKYNKINNVEDGMFSVYSPLDDKTMDKIKDKGIDIEDNYYRDVKFDDKTLRIYEERKSIDCIYIEEGTSIKNDNDIILEKHFAEANNYKLGDELALAGKTYKICGKGSVPDYNLVKVNPSDVASATKKFSVCFVNKKSFESVTNSNDNDLSKIIYSYSYKLNDKESAKEFKDYLIDNTTLTGFLQSTDNSRIYDYKNDSGTTKNGSLIFGIFFIILMAYIITNFTIHKIESESAVIGTLYSMGYVKSELMRHFIILPIIVMTLASIVGVALGFSVFLNLLASDSVAYYSFPKLEVQYPGYLLLYGLLLPIIITVIVSYVVMNRRLSQAPLNLLKNIKKQHKISKIKLGNISFINKYRIRQVMREFRSNIILFFGLFFGTMLLMLGFSIYGSVRYYVDHITDDIKYSYIYGLKQPLSTVPDGSEKAITKNLAIKYDLLGSNMDVTLQGIDKNNQFFDFNCNKSKDEIYISDSAAIKFNLRVGDTVTLIDTLEDKNYAFKVKGKVPFSNGIYMFMNIDSMRTLFDMKDEYYNTLLSSKKLSIEKDYLVSTTTLDDIKNEANSILERMMMMISVMVFTSIIVFIIVMYLLLKMMIEKSKFSISLIKVFGYSDKEIRKLYLGSAFYTVLISIAISIPISKIILNKVYPFLVENVSTGMFAYISVGMYCGIVLIILSTYTVVNFFLKRQLNKISLVEILKDRE